jgi:phage terminase small subunit
MEPEPQKGAGKCPAYLDEAPKEEWERVSAIIERMRVLTEACQYEVFWRLTIDLHVA